jgi:hypothetical protein
MGDRGQSGEVPNVHPGRIRNGEVQSRGIDRLESGASVKRTVAGAKSRRPSRLCIESFGSPKRNKPTELRA